jgi:hypothetical protein
VSNSLKNLKSRSQNERVGSETDEIALNQKFTFSVSSIETWGIDAYIFFDLGEIIQGMLNRRRFVCEVLEVQFIPIILRGDGLRRDDSIKHRRGRKMFEVYKNIDYELWRKARKPKRIKLAEEFFKSSVESIPDRHLSSENKAKLILMIDSAVSSLKRA